MVSLQIKSNTPIEVEKGDVYMDGSAVVIWEYTEYGREFVYGYLMAEGESVRRIAKGKYHVDV